VQPSELIYERETKLQKMKSEHMRRITNGSTVITISKFKF